MEEADLAAGALLPERKLVLLTEAEVFGRSLKRRLTRRTEEFNADYLMHAGLELSVGDYAVHAAYGICRFEGLENKQFQSRRQEVLTLEFQND